MKRRASHNVCGTHRAISSAGPPVQGCGCLCITRQTYKQRQAQGLRKRERAVREAIHQAIAPSVSSVQRTERIHALVKPHRGRCGEAEGGPISVIGSMIRPSFSLVDGTHRQPAWALAVRRRTRRRIGGSALFVEDDSRASWIKYRGQVCKFACLIFPIIL